MSTIPIESGLQYRYGPSIEIDVYFIQLPCSFDKPFEKLPTVSMLQGYFQQAIDASYSTRQHFDVE